MYVLKSVAYLIWTSKCTNKWKYILIYFNFKIIYDFCNFNKKNVHKNEIISDN